MKEPDLETLALYRAGRLDEAEARRVADHLRSGCRQCNLALEWLAGVESVIEEPLGRALPDHLELTADRIFRQYFGARRREAATGRQRAVCIFDSLLRPLPSGVRPAVVDTRRLLYVSDGYEIDIETGPAGPGRFSLMGQVSCAGRPVVSARIAAKVGRKTLKTTTDDFGVFTLRNLTAREVDLTMHTEADTIEILQIPVG